MTDRIGDLLRAVDRQSPRPAGAPITLAQLQARARRKRARSLAGLLLALALPGAAATLAFAHRRVPATAHADAGVSRWLRQMRARDAESSLRELLSLQRVERARERAAIATSLYAERVHPHDPARGAALLQHTVQALPGTRGAQDAARLLAALPSDQRR